MNFPVPQDLLLAVAKIAGTEDVEAFGQVLAHSIMPNPNVKPAEIATFLMVAKEYKLNPITKEIYAFPNRGGIQPIVSIDGWLKIINSHPQFDGMEFDDKLDANGNVTAITCRIYRKDREHAVEMTEYMAECHRNTEPWKQWPHRMLRHKATIQAARYAFGFSGIVDPDEAERIDTSIAPKATDIHHTPRINPEQVAEINKLLDDTGSDKAKFLNWTGASSVEQMNDAQYQRALKVLSKKQTKQEPIEAEHTEAEVGEEIPL